MTSQRAAAPPAPVALVTGAGRGIGRHLASMLSADGFTVALIGRNRVLLDEAAAGLDGTSVVAVADVTDPAQVQAAVDSVRRQLGTIDLLVNNAGVRETTATKPWEADPQDWWRVLEVNLRGVMLMTSAVLPEMVERRSGRILDLGSGAGTRAEPRYSAYSVSKAAALHWMANVVAGLGDSSGVTVVSASPGLVRTDMTETMWGSPDEVSFGSVEPITRFVREYAQGRLDRFHGRFVHTVNDEF